MITLLLTVMLSTSYATGYQMGYCSVVYETNQSACEDVSEQDILKSKRDHATDDSYQLGFDVGREIAEDEASLL